jgi:hemerythrin
MTAALIDWSDELSVGIQEIDEQHKVLVDLTNQLHEAIVNRHAGDVTMGILTRLREYTKTHFTVEESLMRILGYPDYEEHKVGHERLIEQLERMVEKVELTGSSVSFELMHFLKNWLTRHIMEEDQLYSGYFLERGVKPQWEKRSWISRFWHHD